MPTSCGRHNYTRKISQKIAEKQNYLFDNTLKKTHKIAVEIHASTTALTRFPGGLTLCMQTFRDIRDTLNIYTVYRTCIESNLFEKIDHFKIGLKYSNSSLKRERLLYTGRIQNSWKIFRSKL